MVSAPPLRVVFFGTPAFAVPTLEALAGSPHEIAAVVTQPDRPRGRGQRTGEPAVKVAARARGLDVWQPDRLKDEAFLARLAGLRADIGVVAAYGRILPEALLQVPPRGLVNVHASLLPRYRGAAPVHRAVIAGETRTGVTIMRVVLELDAGPMLDAAERPIGPDETSADVERDLASLGATLLRRTLDRIAAGEARETPQDESQATYAPRLRKEEGLVDWSLPAQAIHNLARGLHPWPHAFTHLDEARCVIHSTRAGAPGAATGAAPGAILRAEGDDLVVAAGDAAALHLLRIQPEGRRVMSAREFLAGHRVRPGARFGAAPGS